jgi:uroporphyrinogen decarboxylase
VVHETGRAFVAEYRELRIDVPMLQACMNPELVCEITLQPVRRHGVDAAILFSDIMVPLHAAGVGLDIVPGTGPVVDSPVRSASDVAALMHSAPDVWHTLLDRLAELTLTFLRVQAAAGVDAVQLFDSWTGVLSQRDYRQFVFPYSARVLAGLADTGLPRIHFGVGTGELLGAMTQAGADIVGVDWRIPLDVAAQRVRAARAHGPIVLQGNLDPAVLLAGWPVVEREARRVIIEGRSADAHVLNLGHGVLPETDPDVLTRVVELAHSQ